MSAISLGIFHAILMEEEFSDWSGEAPKKGGSARAPTPMSVRNQLLLDFLKEPSKLLHRVLDVVRKVHYARRSYVMPTD